jgi:hypothetical protein
MAFDILSIPATSDEAERVFSGARRTISWDRTKLEPETVEAVECLKQWKRSGILNEILLKFITYFGIRCSVHVSDPSGGRARRRVNSYEIL